MAASLGANIAANATQNMSAIASIASGIPLACFDNIANGPNPNTLITAISSMDLGNMGPFRKNYIASKVIKIFFFKSI